MKNNGKKTLVERDLNHNWHPCSQMKDYEAFPPLPVHRAEGVYLELEDGTQILDAISSWWCKSLGHAHPRLKKALLQQSEQFEHIIFANTTYPTIVELSERLAQLIPQLNKIFYASEGSSAVEIALKMSLHAHQIKGETQRTQFVGLKNGYHGETALAMSVSDLSLYRKPYEPILQQYLFIQEVPYVSSRYDSIWNDCSESWHLVEQQLAEVADQISAVIIEPILQGAGGMLVYSQDFLRRLRKWTKERGIYLIADEIMTGLGRTGTSLACHHAMVEPDFLCLAKGLTAGWLPMSAVLTNSEIYSLFYDDYKTGKSFLHSHTHSGNALCAAVALECLRVLEEEKLYDRVQSNEKVLAEYMKEVADATKKLTNIRFIGNMAAADLTLPGERIGYRVFQSAIKLGAWLRPLGNTIYWTPPFIIEKHELACLRDITIKAIREI